MSQLAVAVVRLYMGSNHTQVMDVCVCVYSVFVLSCV
jgi:hypothetical protein